MLKKQAIKKLEKESRQVNDLSFSDQQCKVVDIKEFMSIKATPYYVVAKDAYYKRFENEWFVFSKKEQDASPKEYVEYTKIIGDENMEEIKKEVESLRKHLNQTIEYLHQERARVNKELSALVTKNEALEEELTIAYKKSLSEAVSLLTKKLEGTGKKGSVDEEFYDSLEEFPELQRKEELENSEELSLPLVKLPK